jgi:RNA polymerase sigma-70 factor (ECF subfamily)
VRSTVHRSDEELFEAHCRGEPGAFAELVRRRGPALLALLRRGLATPEEAQDLLQQTFLHAHRARHDFRPGARLQPWLYTIALNLKRETLRRRGRRLVEARSETIEDEAAAQASPEEVATGADRVRRLEAALAKLPAAQREVVELHWRHDLSFGELASVLGIGVSAAKVRAHRAYKTLRDLLGSHEGGRGI